MKTITESSAQVSSRNHRQKAQFTRFSRQRRSLAFSRQRRSPNRGAPQTEALPKQRHSPTRSSSRSHDSLIDSEHYHPTRTESAPRKSEAQHSTDLLILACCCRLGNNLTQISLGVSGSQSIILAACSMIRGSDCQALEGND